MLRQLPYYLRRGSNCFRSLPCAAVLEAFNTCSLVSEQLEVNRTPVGLFSSAACQAPYRGFATGGSDATQLPARLAEAHSILQRIDIARFREVIDHESQYRWNMEYEEFLNLCMQSGVATSKEDAESICEALDRSGIVLRVRNLVYLRPLEVAEIIYKALPDTDSEVRARLNQLKAEIKPLQLQKQAIDNHARRVSRIVLWGGLLAMLAQWGIFVRLTFWELSWDVMEPLTYFTGSAFGILAYAYCVWYNEEFGFHRARERIHSSLQDKSYQRRGFDKERFDYLLRRIHRLESSLSSVQASGVPQPKTNSTEAEPARHTSQAPNLQS